MPKYSETDNSLGKVSKDSCMADSDHDCAVCSDCRYFNIWHSPPSWKLCSAWRSNSVGFFIEFDDSIPFFTGNLKL